jgi:L-rhamnose mutarotase
MPQVAFHIELNPGSAEEYVRLHSPVPREISDQLAAAGIRDFSIFLDGDHVFGVFRYEKEELLLDHLSHDAHPEWTQAIVSICKKREVDPQLPLLKRLERVFRFDQEES